MKICLIGLLSLISFSAMALDHSKCSAMMNKGMWKTYKYAGIDQPLTKATKDHGTTKSTSATSTEGSTAILDPKYWSNVSTSQTQAISSWGNCSLLGFDNIKRMRDDFFQEHADQIMAQIAKGEDGEFLKVLSAYSLCDDAAQAFYVSELKNNFTNIQSAKMPTDEIDKIVSSDKYLNQACFSFNLN